MGSESRGKRTRGMQRNCDHVVLYEKRNLFSIKKERNEERIEEERGE